MVLDKYNPYSLAAANGTTSIGAAQRTIAYSAVAAGPAGYIEFTMATHNLKKGSNIYVPSGEYAGVHRVAKVISPTVVRVVGTFGATHNGTVSLTGAINGYGFIVDTVPVTFAELIPDHSGIDTVALQARGFTVGQWVYLPFKVLRLSAGNVTVVRKGIQTELPYTNR
ncbi:MAG: hypothetical protein WKF87_06855 [Chryseolinea sp.]